MVTLFMAKSSMNHFIKKKIESVQHKTALAVAGAIRGTNNKRHYQELGVESLQNRHKLQRICLFYKIYKDHTLSYLYKLIPKNCRSSYSLRTTKEIHLFRVKYGFFLLQR